VCLCIFQYLTLYYIIKCDITKPGKLCQWTVRYKHKFMKLQLSRTFLCKLLISNSMVSRLDKHALVSFSKTSNIVLVLRIHAILRSLPELNSLVHVISKLHSKPCYYLYLHAVHVLMQQIPEIFLANASNIQECSVKTHGIVNLKFVHCSNISKLCRQTQTSFNVMHVH
jgi:hypothetical protein